MFDRIRSGENGLEKLTLEVRATWAPKETKPKKEDNVPPGDPRWERYGAYQKYQTAKQRLPFASFSGVFSRRMNENILEHNGLVVIDLDGLHQLELDVIRERAKTLKPVLIHKTPSGRGFRILMRVHPIPVDNDDHHLAWAAAAALFKEEEQYLDPQTKDTSRGSYIVHDPDAYYDPDGQPVHWERPKQVRLDDDIKSAEWWVSRIPNLTRQHGEWKGPCPICGEGNDRFWVKEGFPPTCRICEANGVSRTDFMAQLYEFVKTPEEKKKERAAAAAAALRQGRKGRGRPKDEEESDDARRKRWSRLYSKAVQAKLPLRLWAHNLERSDSERIRHYMPGRVVRVEGQQTVLISDDSGLWDVLDTEYRTHPRALGCVEQLIHHARQKAIEEMSAYILDDDDDWDGYMEMMEEKFPETSNYLKDNIAKTLHHWGLTVNMGIRRIPELKLNNHGTHPIIPLTDEQGGWDILENVVLKPDELREQFVLDHGFSMPVPEMSVLESGDDAYKPIKGVVENSKGELATPYGIIVRRMAYNLLGIHKSVDTVIVTTSDFGKTLVAEMVQRAFSSTMVSRMNAEDVFQEGSRRFTPLARMLTTYPLCIVDEIKSETTLPDMNKLTNDTLPIERKTKDIVETRRVGNPFFMGGEIMSYNVDAQGVANRLKWVYMPPNAAPMAQALRDQLVEEYYQETAIWLQARMLVEAHKIRQYGEGITHTAETHESRRALFTELTDPAMHELRENFEFELDGWIPTAEIEAVLEARELEIPKSQAFRALIAKALPYARQDPTRRMNETTGKRQRGYLNIGYKSPESKNVYRPEWDEPVEAVTEDDAVRAMEEVENIVNTPVERQAEEPDVKEAVECDFCEGECTCYQTQEEA